jgi:hypothetical protein
VDVAAFDQFAEVIPTLGSNRFQTNIKLTTLNQSCELQSYRETTYTQPGLRRQLTSMLTRSTFLRASRPLLSNAARPTARAPLRRHYASEELSGPADNAFNRERLAVKHPAAETSGMRTQWLINIVC